MRRSDIELLAPVGSIECLAAAAKGGANAVYFGAGPLNMRSASGAGFAVEQLPELVSRARDAGMKSYLTLNVVVFDDDLSDMQRTLDAAARSGCDAVIAADVSVMEAARERGLAVHASTQANIANLRAVAFYARWADTVVLARELSLERIKAIADAIEREPVLGPSGLPVRIEAFAHGALCMAVSGQCYMSLHTHGQSANRGRCVQVCRRSYELADKDDQENANLRLAGPYILSPKDLCALPFLDRVMAAGVRVLKIEGRARPPEYVLSVTRAYNEALEAIAGGGFSPELARRLEEGLAASFNRGFWAGHYLGATMPELSGRYGSASPVRKRFVGTVDNFYAKPSVVEFLAENDGPADGEAMLFVGPTTGVVEAVASGMLADERPSAKPAKGSRVTMRVGETVRRGDKVYALEPRP